jgi:hypothetical protein
MRTLLQLLLCTLLSAATAAVALADVGVVADEGSAVQLGGGYGTTVACDGTKLRFKRLSADEVVVSCHPKAVRAVPPVAESEVRLDPGESTTLLCQGLKLVTKRQGGARVKASCTAIAPAAI